MSQFGTACTVSFPDSFITVPAAPVPLCLAGFVSAKGQSVSAADARNHIGEKATVCGKVASERTATRSRGEPTFINLDAPYPDLSAKIRQSTSGLPDDLRDGSKAANAAKPPPPKDSSSRAAKSSRDGAVAVPVAIQSPKRCAGGLM